LAGILAAHDLEHRRNLQAIWMAGAALVLSLGSIIAQLV
jgi:hypothetical protein